MTKKRAMSEVRCKWRNLFVIVAVAIAVFSPVGAPKAAPITFNTALPVGEGEFVFGEQFVVGRSGDDPSGKYRDREELAAISVLGYGATPELAVFGILPYLERRLATNADGERRARSARGIGDFTLFGRYTVYQESGPGRTFRIAPLAGVKTPTGEEDERDAFGRKPPDVETGTGSWDPFAGVVLTYATLTYQIDTQAAYREHTEAGGFEAGNEARFDGSLQYRLLPWRLAARLPDFLYGVVEANLIHREKDRIGGVDDPNSGGFTLFLVPGLQYATKRWIAEAAVQLPAFQDLNGTALENGYTVRFGFRVNF